MIDWRKIEAELIGSLQRLGVTVECSLGEAYIELSDGSSVRLSKVAEDLASTIVPNRA